jgi:hypothetical protein
MDNEPVRSRRSKRRSPIHPLENKILKPWIIYTLVVVPWAEQTIGPVQHLYLHLTVAEHRKRQTNFSTFLDSNLLDFVVERSNHIWPLRKTRKKL